MAAIVLVPGESWDMHNLRCLPCPPHHNVTPAGATPICSLQMLVQPLDRIFHVIRTNASQVIQALGTQAVRLAPEEGA